jgi:hypothetical protein
VTRTVALDAEPRKFGTVATSLPVRTDVATVPTLDYHSTLHNGLIQPQCVCVMCVCVCVCACVCACACACV